MSMHCAKLIGQQAADKGGQKKGRVQGGVLLYTNVLSVTLQPSAKQIFSKRHTVHNKVGAGKC